MPNIYMWCVVHKIVLGLSLPPLPLSCRKWIQAAKYRWTYLTIIAISTVILRATACKYLFISLQHGASVRRTTQLTATTAVSNVIVVLANKCARWCSAVGASSLLYPYVATSKQGQVVFFWKNEKEVKWVHIFIPPLFGPLFLLYVLRTIYHTKYEVLRIPHASYGVVLEYYCHVYCLHRQGERATAVNKVYYNQQNIRTTTGRQLYKTPVSVNKHAALGWSTRATYTNYIALLCTAGDWLMDY